MIAADHRFNNSMPARQQKALPGRVPYCGLLFSMLRRSDYGQTLVTIAPPRAGITNRAGALSTAHLLRSPPLRRSCA